MEFLTRQDIHIFIWKDLNIDFLEQTSAFQQEEEEELFQEEEGYSDSLYTILSREIIKINNSKVF